MRWSVYILTKIIFWQLCTLLYFIIVHYGSFSEYYCDKSLLLNFGIVSEMKKNTFKSKATFCYWKGNTFSENIIPEIYHYIKKMRKLIVFPNLPVILHFLRKRQNLITIFHKYLGNIWKRIFPLTMYIKKFPKQIFCVSLLKIL